MLIPRAMPHDDAYNVFMTLPPYTGTGEETRQWGGSLKRHRVGL